MSRSKSTGRMAPATQRARWLTASLVIGAYSLYPLPVLSAIDPVTNDGPTYPVVRSGRSTIAIEVRGPRPDVGPAGIQDWVARSARIVRGYFGEFPVPAVTIRVTTTDGASMGSGKTYGYPEPHIEVTVGQHASAQSLTDDWVLVHEMTHLALPVIDDDHNWLAEGVAVYVEGIARTQAGNMTETALWSEYASSMPKGLPQANDQGLDRTHTWARTYWGGALYCLIADVQIREKTSNRRGLQDALRAIERAAGGMAKEWPIERILRVGDAATETSVMTDLYLKMKDQPFAPDLSTLWADLGVEVGDGPVHLDNHARQSDIRSAITRAPLLSSSPQ